MDLPEFYEFPPRHYLVTRRLNADHGQVVHTSTSVAVEPRPCSIRPQAEETCCLADAMHLALQD